MNDFGGGLLIMDVVLRRLTIITLTMAIFAMGFSALVVADTRGPKRVHYSTATPCLHPASSFCVVQL